LQSSEIFHTSFSEEIRGKPKGAAFLVIKTINVTVVIEQTHPGLHPPLAMKMEFKNLRSGKYTIKIMQIDHNLTVTGYK
jgi:hypothetical protein